MKPWIMFTVLACIVALVLPNVLGEATTTAAHTDDDEAEDDAYDDDNDDNNDDDNNDDDDAGDDDDEHDEGHETTTGALTTSAPADHSTSGSPTTEQHHTTTGDPTTTTPGPMRFRLSTLEPAVRDKVLSPSLAMYSTTEQPLTATDDEGDEFHLALDTASPRCGDPKYKYHFKKFSYSHMFTGLSDVDACCVRPDIQSTQDIQVINATCCLTQGSLCDDGAMSCCKNAKCMDTEMGEKRCDFKAGFWQTSKSLNVPFAGWIPAKTPRLCEDPRYLFYREATASIAGQPPVSGCCAMQDTTEPSNVYRSCCMNTQRGCCFQNGFCRRYIPSKVVPHELRENDFQKKIDQDTLRMIQ